MRDFIAVRGALDVLALKSKLKRVEGRNGYLRCPSGAPRRGRRKGMLGNEFSHLGSAQPVPDSREAFK